MKNAKNVIMISAVSVVILLLSLVVMLLDILVPLNFWTHPILNFFFCLFFGFSVLSLYYGFKYKSAIYVFLGAILIGLAVFYVIMQYLFWWVGFIVVFVLWAVIGIFGGMCFVNKTEQVLNDSPNYKTCEKRETKKIQTKQSKESEELPKIKSFK